jgi:hypothetical protein
MMRAVDPVRVPDLRFGAAPLPAPSPGYDPEGDSRALILAGTPSCAPHPVPGREIRGSAYDGQRFFVRIPDAWNGRLGVCGTPATRSEHANDAIFGDYLLANGYAYAASNKGIPFNAVIEGPAATPRSYALPFPLGALAPGDASIRFGCLEEPVRPIAAWHEDFADLVRAAREIVCDVRGRAPERTYALGLSMGGGQVRWLLERHPELVDGGVEWAAVHWNVEHAFVRYLPHFLANMPAYVASGYRDPERHDAIVRAGFPPDRLQAGALASLWDAHYSSVPPFYADVTPFMFAGVLDPAAPPLATLADRAAYAPSVDAERAIETIAHSGRIERPLVGIAGEADAFITPQHNFEPYVRAVVATGRGELFWPFEVADGTHVDPFAAFGWDLQPQLPFARRAFDLLVGIVERGARPGGAGRSRRVTSPDEM